MPPFPLCGRLATRRVQPCDLLTSCRDDSHLRCGVCKARRTATFQPSSNSRIDSRCHPQQVGSNPSNAAENEVLLFFDLQMSRQVPELGLYPGDPLILEALCA
jgi:hypothetical protein